MTQPLSDTEAEALVEASAKAVARFLTENGNNAATVRALLGACIGCHIMGAGKEATIALLVLTLKRVADKGDKIVDESEAFAKDQARTVQ